MKTIVFLAYLLLLLINLFGKSNERFSKNALNVSIFIMFLLSVFKDGSRMPDHHVYKSAYDMSNTGEKLPNFEFSYTLISRLFGHFDDAGFNLVLGVYSAIFLLTFRKIFRLFPENGLSSILLFYSNAFLIFGLIQIRAGAALALIYSAILIYERKSKKYLKWITSIFLHVSSIIFIPLKFLLKTTIQKRTAILFLIVAFGLSQLILPLAKLIVDFIPISYIQSKALTYLIEERIQSLKLNFLGPNFILRSILFIIFISFWNTFNSSKERILLYFYTIGFYIYIALSSMPEIAFRIANSLFLAEVFLIPIVVNRIKQKKGRFIIIAFYSGIQLIVNIIFTSYFNYTTN